MGSIPTANPSPPRPWRFSRRVVPLAMLAVAAVALVVVGVAVIWQGGSGDSGWTTVASFDEVAVNEPLAVDRDVYLVLLESGEILALSRVDPHLGCLVDFRPDFKFMDRSGWFRNPCHGETYDLTGALRFGPSPRGLDRYEVRVRDGDVEVNFANLIEGPAYDEEHEPITPG